MPVCSRSLVMLTPPVEAEQGPLALVSEEMRVEKSMHCMEGGARGRDCWMAVCTLGAKQGMTTVRPAPQTLPSGTDREVVIFAFNEPHISGCRGLGATAAGAAGRRAARLAIGQAAACGTCTSGVNMQHGTAQ